MITEDYVSFEVAKLLKEKGFNEKCVAYYPQCITPIKLTFGGRVNYNSSNKFKMLPPISAPTHQMTMAWLREKNISIEPSVVKPHYWVYTIYEILNNKVKELYNDGGFDSYKKAVEAALKYVLKNLI